MQATTTPPNEDSLRRVRRLALALVGGLGLALAGCTAGPGLEPPGKATGLPRMGSPTSPTASQAAGAGALPGAGAAGSGFTEASEPAADAARAADAGLADPAPMEEDAGSDDSGMK
jgi:hypothetical protein